MSELHALNGVRNIVFVECNTQGGVLSPYVFAVFIDSVVQRVQASGTGCYVKFTRVCIIVYAGDILLLALSVTALQQLLYACEVELDLLDMTINVN